MINARKILRNVRTMTQQERIGLHSGRKPWLLDIVVDDDFGNIPREVMFTCLRMYIEQQCKNGYKPLLRYGCMTSITAPAREYSIE